MARIMIVLAFSCLAVLVLSEGKAVQYPADTQKIEHYKQLLANNPELQKFISTLSSDQKALIKKYPSQAQALLDALHRPDGKGATAKRNEMPSKFDLQQFISRLPADQQALIRAHPSEAKALLEALQRQWADAGRGHGTARAKKQVEEDDVDEILQELLPHLAALQDIMENAKNRQHVEAADVEKVKEKIVADVTFAKENGVKLEDLLQGMNKRARKH